MATSDPWITLGRGYQDSLRIVSDPTREVYVAKAQGELAGFLILSMTGPFVGYVQTLCVHPDHQRRGVGTLLLRFAEERIFRESPNVFLCVSSFNTDARRLYHRLGYDVVGEWTASPGRGHSGIRPPPRERAVELVAPTRFVAKLQEPPVPGDPTSGQQNEQLPTYNAYSTDGDVTGPLVYVNYGVPGDYEQLERLGVSVQGAIVIARYGGSWRGIKPKVAAEHGAVGCLIYSDPRDDGYRQGDVYPQGPWRPRDGVPRGRVADMPRYPGDPLTPGVGATPGAKRLPLAEAPTITKIPVLPISYGDAQPLLAAVRGPMAPDAWRGALPLTYRIGPGPAKVHLRVKSDWSTKPLYDVIAPLPGASAADQWIMRGNHHDAWVNGAQDPISAPAPPRE